MWCTPIKGGENPPPPSAAIRAAIPPPAQQQMTQRTKPTTNNKQEHNTPEPTLQNIQNNKDRLLESERELEGETDQLSFGPCRPSAPLFRRSCSTHRVVCCVCWSVLSSRRSNFIGEDKPQRRRDKRGDEKRNKGKKAQHQPEHPCEPQYQFSSPCPSVAPSLCLLSLFLLLSLSLSPSPSARSLLRFTKNNIFLWVPSDIKIVVEVTVVLTTPRKLSANEIKGFRRALDQWNHSILDFETIPIPAP